MPEQRKRPPTFQHHPASRAKKLKQTWVQNAKLKRKWRKMRAGDTVTVQEEEEEQTAVDVEQREEPKSAPPKPHTAAEPPLAMVYQQSSLRDRAREAYSRSSLHTYKSGKKQPGGKTGRGQPDMKKRMNILLETIKRDHT
ncbi:hypothetical protein C8F01DRAFT_985587 [Mycena amicta]|nr:hypothetical protein C8F01DRAFT_985587 [Mycena amicta]